MGLAAVVARGAHAVVVAQLLVAAGEIVTGGLIEVVVGGRQAVGTVLLRDPTEQPQGVLAAAVLGATIGLDAVGAGSARDGPTAVLVSLSGGRYRRRLGTGVVRRRANAGELWGRALVSSITGFAEPYVHPETPDPPKALTS